MAEHGALPASRTTGFQLFRQQFLAMLWKNVLLSWRAKVATILQLFSSLIFIFLIWAVNKAVLAQQSNKTYYKNVYDPEPAQVTAIPACDTGFYMKTPCYDFLYSPNNDTSITKIATAMATNNPGRPIPLSSILGFSTPDAVDDWMLANPMHTSGAVYFEVTSAGIGYGIQTNSTTKVQRGQSEDPNFKFRLPLQQAAEREIVAYLTQDDALSSDWTTSFVEFAHPATTTFSVVGTIGPTFLLAAAMFGFVIQIGAVVGERETKLRQAMDTMGLKVSVFWLSWMVWEVILVFISSLFIVIFGLMFQFDFFLNNNFLVLFLTFFLFELAMSSFAFMLSTFLRSSATATTFGFFFFIVGFILQLVVVFGFPYSSTFTKGYRYLFSLFPPNLLAICLSNLGDATSTPESPGIKLSQLTSHCGTINADCVFSLSSAFRWLFAEFIVYFILAFYFDRVFPDVNGVRRPWLFCCYPSYWTGKGSGATASGNACCACVGSLPPPPTRSSPEDEDVARERELVEQQAGSVLPDNVVIQARGLVKTFPSMTECHCGCPCRCTSAAPFHAVQGSSFNIEKDKLFCLLGPNGAGKTTTINMLTGVLPVTSGDAFVHGNSVANPITMARVKTYMGVCPQFDILWGDLTGYEHLWVFGLIKGLPRSEVRQTVDTLLTQVKLTQAGQMRSSSYSGGMKRRLSVAVALIGDPKVVYLDEPTTGMDPVSRRHVWDIIESTKRGRAIILTTHSMEEADILGDRIAIMAKGTMRCLGTSIHLKSKFGAGYILSISVKGGPSHADLANADQVSSYSAVKAFVKQMLDVDPSDESKAYVKFTIPRSKENLLTHFFSELRERKAELGVRDVQLGLTTLEEVFLNIAKQAELETAAAEGRYESLLLANGVTLQVPIGAHFVEVPGSATPEAPYGQMVEVRWQQDDTGTLRIHTHSELMPRPPVANAPQQVPQLQQQSSGLMRRRLSNQQSFGRPIAEGEILVQPGHLPSGIELPTVFPPTPPGYIKP